jgi:ABC-type microcin C transport system duplicated ATPase subunit YejF
LKDLQARFGMALLLITHDLAVVRRMAELIGGTLQISSEAGKGTRVLMKFPSQAGAVAPLVTEQRKYG